MPSTVVASSDSVNVPKPTSGALVSDLKSSDSAPLNVEADSTLNTINPDHQEHLMSRALSFVGGMLSHIPIVNRIVLPLIDPVADHTQNVKEQPLMLKVQMAFSPTIKVRLINDAFAAADDDLQLKEAKDTLSWLSDNLFLYGSALRSNILYPGAFDESFYVKDDSANLLDAGITFDSLTKFYDLEQLDLHPTLETLITPQLLNIMVKAATTQDQDPGHSVRAIHRILLDCNRQLNNTSGKLYPKPNPSLMAIITGFRVGHMGLDSTAFQVVKDFAVQFANQCWAAHYQPVTEPREPTAKFEEPIAEIHQFTDEVEQPIDVFKQQIIEVDEGERSPVSVMFPPS